MSLLSLGYKHTLASIFLLITCLFLMEAIHELPYEKSNL